MKIYIFISLNFIIPIFIFLGGQGDGGGHDGRGGGHTTSSSRNNGFHNGEGHPPGPGHRETGIIEKLLVSVF